MKVVTLVDGQEVVVQGESNLMVVISKGDMDVQVKPGQNYVDIGPEQTVKTANELEQDQWELIRQNERFLGWWKYVWQDSAPPLVLAKSALGCKHIAGLILMVIVARQEGKHMHIQFPETYLHPSQCQRLMSLIYKLCPGLDPSQKHQEAAGL